MNETKENWDLVIKPKAKLLSLKRKELWKYRELIFLFVKRDLTAMYKQNVLGPLWYILQPLASISAYYFMFGTIAKVPTDNKPMLLFYLGGLMPWNYFVDCFNSTSNVFTNNAAIFGKVYFPRLIVPLATIVSSLFKFLVQFVFFLLIWLYYRIWHPEYNLHLSGALVLLPFLLGVAAFMGLGFGLVVSALTSKYRDLRNITGYAVQFALYATPIIYPLSWIKETIPAFYKICLINPMTSIVETFKLIFFGDGQLNIMLLLYSFGFSIVLFFIALTMFNRTEKTFVDTV